MNNAGKEVWFAAQDRRLKLELEVTFELELVTFNIIFPLIPVLFLTMVVSFFFFRRFVDTIVTQMPANWSVFEYSFPLHNPFL